MMVIPKSANAATQFSVTRGPYIIIYHTEVDPSYGGQGIAKMLVMAVKEAADQAGADVISTCSYAYKVLGK